MIHLTNWDINNLDFNIIYSSPKGESFYWKNKLKGDWVNIELYKNMLDMLGNSIPNFNIIIPELLTYISSCKYGCELLKEYIFEELRIKKYKHLPSRKNCIFCFPDDCNIDEMRKKYKLDNKLRPITLRIKGVSNNFIQHTVDSSFLNCNLLKYEEMLEYAEKYWSGIMSDNMLPEIIFSGDFKILEIIDN